MVCLLNLIAPISLHQVERNSLTNRGFSMSVNAQPSAIVTELKALSKYIVIGYGMTLSMLTLGWVMSDAKAGLGGH